MLTPRLDDDAMQDTRTDHRHALQGGNNLLDETLAAVGRERSGGPQDLI